MDEIIQKIQSKLKKHSNQKTEFGEDYAIVYPVDETGLEVRLDSGNKDYPKRHFSVGFQFLGC